MGSVVAELITGSTATFKLQARDSASSTPDFLP